MTVKRTRKRKPLKQIDYDRFKDTRILAGLDVDAAAALLYVSPATVRTWERGKARIPYAAFKLLRIFTGYELPGSPWRGWKLFGDTLWSPDNKPFKAYRLTELSSTFLMARFWREEYHKREALRIAERQRAASAARASTAPHLRLVLGGQP